MTPVVEYLAVASLLFSLAQVGIAIFVTTRAIHYRRVAKFERIRGTFADARNKLLWLAATDQIQVTSVTFRKLYAVQTEMVRDVTSYASLSQSIWIAKLTNSKKTNVFGKESSQWTPEVKEVVRMTADGLHDVWTSCAPFSFMVKLAAALTASLGAFYVNRLSKAAWKTVGKWRQVPPLSQIRDAEFRLRQLV
jgi:hypothetical protein